MEGETEVDAIEKLVRETLAVHAAERAKETSERVRAAQAAQGELSSTKVRKAASDSDARLHLLVTRNAPPKYPPRAGMSNVHIFFLVHLLIVIVLRQKVSSSLYTSNPCCAHYRPSFSTRPLRLSFPPDACGGPRHGRACTAAGPTAPRLLKGAAGMVPIQVLGTGRALHPTARGAPSDRPIGFFVWLHKPPRLFRVLRFNDSRCSPPNPPALPSPTFSLPPSSSFPRFSNLRSSLNPRRLAETKQQCRLML